ncbi:hypothetical protein DFH09DRAFT_1098677 [Mycena vulgaris]|nr:hypothetical protein DFH09DRAFT_1098677 [Mycena vulgaris]
MSKYATVESHANKLPNITKGDLTPLIINDMEQVFFNYFTAKDTAADKQVAMTLGCFHDARMQNWIRLAGERARLTALTFTGFMTEFRKKFLRTDCELTTRTELLSSKMKDTETSQEWSTNVVSLHSLLVGTTSELDNVRIRHTLEAGITAAAVPTADLDAWITAVITINEERIHEIETQHRRIAEMTKAEGPKRKAHNADDGDHTSKKPFGKCSPSLMTTNANG